MLQPPEQYGRTVRPSEGTTTETTSQLFQLQFSPKDQSLPFRVVRSYEYANSLGNRRRLISISTAEEIKAYDRYLHRHPEFTLYQGSSSAF